MHYLILIGCMLLGSACLHSAQVQCHASGEYIELTSLYSNAIITEPILIDLIQHPFFERLKDIHQYGAIGYIPGEPRYTRYQHSLGVFLITRHHGASLREQIAALLHDVSHTIFSHVGDIFFKSTYRTGKKAYQDEIHEWYLKMIRIADILQRYGYGHACSSTAKHELRCFDQELPHLCADRIEYNITGALLDNLLTIDEAKSLLYKLHFKNDEWFFEDTSSALKFGYLSLYLSEHRWGSAWNALVDYRAAQALHRAYELNVITIDDIHFSTDEAIWQVLSTSSDPFIAQQVRLIMQREVTFCDPHDRKNNTLHVCGKFSGTDPFVSVEGALHRLTTLDEEYKQEFERVKKQVKDGFFVAM